MLAFKEALRQIAKEYSRVGCQFIRAWYSFNGESELLQPRGKERHSQDRARNGPDIVSAMLAQWCTNVMHSKVKPMKDVARMIRHHFAGIVAWTKTRQTNGFIETIKKSTSKLHNPLEIQ